MNSSEHPSKQAPYKQPLIAGEVLFDHFPDGKRVIGGAPFNVAWNLRGLGTDPCFLSRVGNDSEGKEVQKSMSAWGLSTEGLQVSSEKPTGRVQVSMVDHQPAYEIVDDQAFDHLDPPAFPVNADTHSLIYSGSLALRNTRTRETVMSLLKDSGLPCFVDVNIRQPWFDLCWASDLISSATWIKVSEGELAFLTDTDCDGDNSAKVEIEAAVAILRERFFTGTAVATCFVTLGERGACAIPVDGNAIWVDPAMLDQEIQDTVGAGDAFVAGTIDGLIREWPLHETLAFASKFAAKACTLQGATINNPDHYATSLR